MEENNVSTKHINIFPDGKSPVSLAFLNENNDAEYLFYKDGDRLKKVLDLTGGYGANLLGHRNPSLLQKVHNFF